MVNLLKTILPNEFKSYFIIFYGKNEKEGVYTVYIRFDGPSPMKVHDLESCFHGIVIKPHVCKDTSGLEYLKQQDVLIYRVDNCPSQTIGLNKHVYSDPVLFLDDDWYNYKSLILVGPLECGSLRYAHHILPNGYQVNFLSQLSGHIDWKNGVIINCIVDPMPFESFYFLCDVTHSWVRDMMTIIPPYTPLIIICTSLSNLCTIPNGINAQEYNSQMIAKLSEVAIIRMVSNQTPLFIRVTSSITEPPPPYQLQKQYIIEAITNKQPYVGTFSSCCEIQEPLPLPISQEPLSEVIENTVHELLNLPIEQPVLSPQEVDEINASLDEILKRDEQARLKELERAVDQVAIDQEEKSRLIEERRKAREDEEIRIREYEKEKREDENRRDLLQAAVNDAFRNDDSIPIRKSFDGSKLGNPDTNIQCLASRSSSVEHEQSHGHGKGRKNISRDDGSRKRKHSSDGRRDKRRREDETEEEREKRRIRNEKAKERRERRKLEKMKEDEEKQN